MRPLTRLFLLALCLSAPPLLPAERLYLDYSTYLGGLGNDRATALAVGPNGVVWLAGSTDSADFPTGAPWQSSLAGYPDAFVACLSASGSGLIYSSYLGGALTDRGYGVAVDSGGVATVSGTTESDDFPTRSPFQGGRAGYTDIFLTRLSPDGSALVFSTYLGGVLHDYATTVARDGDGGAVVTGYTQSFDFPLRNAYQSSFRGGTYDAFVSHLSSTGSVLLYSTLLGGSGMEWGQEIVCDSAGRDWVAGYTASADFPTREPYQASSAGGYDAFLSRFYSDGSLLFSGYIGGSGYEDGYGLCLASSGEPIISGSTGSSDYPTRDAYQASFAGASPSKWDIAVARFTSSGSELVYATYLGGSEAETGFGVALDSAGRVCLTGSTYSDDFPVCAPLPVGRAGLTDAVVVRLSSSGSALDYSTFLGGNDEDNGWAIGLDAEGNACVAGKTSSGDFPVSGAYQSTHGGGEDAFAAKLGFRAPTPPPYVIDSGDYDGDGTSEIGVFRGSSGLWSIRELTRVYFGGSADYPVPADYAGDGTASLAVFRPADGLWSVRGVTRLYFGVSGDYLVPGDYGGNGTSAPAVFRPSAGLWSVRNVTRVYFGGAADTAVPGLYRGAGQGKIPAVYRPSQGRWSVFGLTRFYFGSSADAPVAGDYGGDAGWEAAVFRPENGMWSVRDTTRIYFGGSLDAPVPAKYPGSPNDALGVFRPSSGLWSVRNLTRLFFGSTGDVPVTR